MIFRPFAAGLTSALLLASCDAADGSSAALISVGEDPATYSAGQEALSQRLALTPNTGKAKNVILFIGDGMGISTLTAARIHAGQKQGKAGEEHVLAMERLPYSALVKTYNTNQQVADSAGTATAMVTGTKTKSGVINIGPAAARQDCAASQENTLPSIAQQASDAGLATGVVTTTRITHATPAVMYAHSPERNWEGPQDVPDAARALGCISMAEQLIGMEHGLDVALGGGARGFTDIVQDWPTPVVTTAAEMDGYTDSGPLLGLFSQSHMPYTRETPEGSDVPSLEQMTRKAISRLETDPDGYFLMVEAGRIDHGHHAGKAELALDDTIAFDEAIAATLEMVDLEETLILVTADHSHVFTFAGYPTRGNPILGVVKSNDASGAPTGKAYIAPDGEPYTTLGYHNGPGAVEGVRDPRTQPGEVVHQVAAIEARSETHGGEDVALFAAGPGAYLAHGVLEQHVIYHLMRHALRLGD